MSNDNFSTNVPDIWFKHGIDFRVAGRGIPSGLRYNKRDTPSFCEVHRVLALVPRTFNLPGIESKLNVRSAHKQGFSTSRPVCIRHQICAHQGCTTLVRQLFGAIPALTSKSEFHPQNRQLNTAPSALFSLHVSHTRKLVFGMYL